MLVNMKKLILFFFVLTLATSFAQAQENKNELGVSLFSIETYDPGHYAFGIGGYINPINSIIYKRSITQDFKLRGIATAEVNASNMPHYQEECNDCGSFIHTANSIGLSAGAQTGRTFQKFSPYGYADIFYQYKYETAEYLNPWGSAGQYSKNVNSFGIRVGFGLEYNFTERFSISLEPSLSVAQNSITGEGFEAVQRSYQELEWNQEKETSTNFRAVNILAVNVKF